MRCTNRQRLRAYALVLPLLVMAPAPASAAVPVNHGAAASAASTDELVVDKSTVVFGPLAGAARGGEVDINEVYANHPAFMRMEELGLDTSDGRGKKLLNQAKKSVKSALAAVASDEDLHVITHLGGVTGGEIDIEDHTAAVIDLLPVYHIDGSVWAGKSRARDNIAEMDKEAVLEAIPAYRDWLNLAPSDTEYHFLKEEWNRIYQGALNSVVRDESFEAVVQTGGVTSRLEPAPEITDMVIEALGS